MPIAASRRRQTRSRGSSWMTRSDMAASGVLGSAPDVSTRHVKSVGGGSFTGRTDPDLLEALPASGAAGTSGQGWQARRVKERENDSLFSGRATGIAGRDIVPPPTPSGLRAQACDISGRTSYQEAYASLQEQSSSSIKAKSRESLNAQRDDECRASKLWRAVHRYW